MAGGGSTTTGAVLEEMVLPALRRGGYLLSPHVNIGTRFGGGRHVVDVVAEKQGESHLVSLKWQQVSGTAEQKVPFEAMCLAEAILAYPDKYASAYLVLGGSGWKLRDFYVSGGLAKHLRHGELVEVVTLEQFIALSNNGNLRAKGLLPAAR